VDPQLEIVQASQPVTLWVVWVRIPLGGSLSVAGRKANSGESPTPGAKARPFQTLFGEKKPETSSDLTEKCRRNSHGFPNLLKSENERRIIE